MAMRSRFLCLVAVPLACGGGGVGPEPAAPKVDEPRAARAAPPPAAKEPARCPDTVDARELLVRHARAFGGPDAIARALPLAVSGEVEVSGQNGSAEVVLAKDAFRSISQVGGLVSGAGIDASGAWELAAGAGVVERLAGVREDADARFEDWLLRRAYVNAKPERVTCTEERAGARVELAWNPDGHASSVLTFDLESASLVAVAHRRTDGRIERTTIDAWSAPDAAHLRWPKKTSTHPSVGSPTTVTWGAPRSAAPCEDCAAAPRDQVGVTWPASGKVEIPFTFARRSILVQATLGGATAGGREVRALFDSGASITVLDETTPAGEAFVPALALEGASSTQRIRVGVGTVASLAIGDLALSNLPVASVPIPALDAMGKDRPEAILGYSIFASSVVRIDYARSKVVLAKPGTALAAKSARSAPLRVAHGKMLVEAMVEDESAWFELDTGDTGALDLYRRWETAHGLPGARATAEVTGRFGAGTEETGARFFRLKHASLGPISLRSALVHDGDPPDSGDVAGLAGNSALARCDAIVIDHHARTLSFEGACDRAVPENLMMWRFAKKPDPAHEGRPWVVELIVPGSSVERAGVKKGDRVLEVAGKPVGDDLSRLEKIETQPAGTRVPVVLARDGKTVRVVVVLAPILR